MFHSAAPQQPWHAPVSLQALQLAQHRVQGLCSHHGAQNARCLGRHGAAKNQGAFCDLDNAIIPGRCALLLYLVGFRTPFRITYNRRRSNECDLSTRTSPAVTGGLQQCNGVSEKGHPSTDVHMPAFRKFQAGSMCTTAVWWVGTCVPRARRCRCRARLTMCARAPARSKALPAAAHAE